MLPAETGFDEPEPEIDSEIYSKSIGYDPDTYRIELIGDAGHPTADLKIRIDVYRDGEKLPPEEYTPEEVGFVDGHVQSGGHRVQAIGTTKHFRLVSNSVDDHLAGRRRFRSSSETPSHIWDSLE